MRVALFAHRISPRQPTGIARYLRELVQALGHLSGPEADFVLASTREQEAAGWVPSEVATRVVPWPRRAVQAAWMLGAGPRLERALGKVDAVHLIQPFPPVCSAAPQLVTVHDLFPLEHPQWYPRSEQISHRRSLALQARRAARIVVPSVYVAQGIETRLGVPRARIDVIPLGVSGAFARSGDDAAIARTCARLGVSPGGYALCVGAVSARKNLIPVIRAFTDSTAMPLLLVGPDGHGVDRIEAEIGRRGGDVRRTGFLPDADAAALVAGALAVVHPALAEGFGFVPLEAMAAGTPVIASAVGSVPEVVGDAAVLVRTPSEPEAWSAAVDELRDDPDRRSARVAAGLRRAAELTWERSARTLLGVYAEVAGH